MARLLIPITIVLLLDLYFFQAIRTVLFDAPQGTRKVIQFSYWIVNIAMYSALVYASLKPELLVYQRYYVFSLFLVLVVPKLIGTVVLFGEDLLRIGEGFYNSLTDSSNGPFLPSRRKFISTVSIISSAIPMSAMVFGMVKTAFDTQVRKRKLVLKDLPPSFNGLKVVQISDLHSGSFASVDHFRSAFERIRDLKPDIIFFHRRPS